jgi:isopenicillin-N N-acyltransferase-like protein
MSEVRTFLPVYEEFAPHIIEEMVGLSHVADLEFEEVLLLNLRDELKAARQLQPVEACTAFGCSGDVTPDGTPIFGQTKDTVALSANLYVVVAVYQKGRPDLLEIRYPGEVHGLGLSSSGMAILGNSLHVGAGRDGRIPCGLFRRLTLEADNLDAVVALANQHGVATPGSFIIGDHTGRIVALENTNHGRGFLYAERGILVHANHVIAPHLQKYERYEEPERTISVHRQLRLNHLLEAERGHLTAPLAMRCLMDHNGYPSSICRHSMRGRDFQTSTAIVAEPAQTHLSAIRGLPCQAWPTVYVL